MPPTDREVVPGEWGRCSCHRWTYATRKTADGESQIGWSNNLEHRFRVDTAGLIVYCEGCGDGCYSGGHVRPNLRRHVERLVSAVSSAHPDAVALGLFEAWAYRIWRPLLALGCPHCKGSGYVARPGVLEDDGDISAVREALMPCPECQPDRKEAAADD